MKNVLLIKTASRIPADKLMQIHDNYVKQLESGILIIPAYFDAELLNVPDEIEVIVESGSVSDFMSKNLTFNINLED